MPVLVDKQVFRLEVAIDDVLAVKVLDCEQDLGDVEEGDILTKAAVLAQAREELPAGDVLEKHVDAFVVLEGGFELDEEWVLDLDEDVLLGLYVVDLLELDDVVLLHDLERIDLAAGVPADADLLDAAEGAGTEGSVDFEAIDGEGGEEGVIWVAALARIRQRRPGLEGLERGFLVRGLLVEPFAMKPLQFHLQLLDLQVVHLSVN